MLILIVDWLPTNSLSTKSDEISFTANRYVTHTGGVCMYVPPVGAEVIS